MAQANPTSGVTSPHNVPPQNIEAEESVLGAMLVAEPTLTRVIDEVKLNAGDFYLDKHATIFTAVHDLYAASKPVDELSVTEALTQRNQIEEAGGKHYVSELAAKVPAAGNAKHYAEIVQQNSLLRRLLGAGQQIQGWVHDRDGDSPDELVERAERGIAKLRQGAGRASRRPPTVDTLGDLIARAPEKVEGLLGRWLVAGEIGSVAARGGVGKTTFTRTLIARAAAGASFLGVPFARPLTVLYSTREGSGPFWVAKMRRIAEALALDEEALGRIHVVEGGGDCGLRLSRPEDVNTVRRFAEKIAPDLLVFDPFRGFLDGNENEGADVAAALDGAKELAGEFEAAVWIPHHASQAGRGLDAFRGHTTFEGEIATGFVLEAVDDDRRLDPVKVRYSMGPDDDRLRFLTFDRDTEVYAEDDREESLSTRERLRRVLADKEWHKVAELAASIGVTRQALKPHLEGMLATREVDREKREHGAEFVRFRDPELEIGDGSI